MSRSLRLLCGAVVLCAAAGAGGGWFGVEYGMSRMQRTPGLDELLHRDLSLTPKQNAEIAHLESAFAVKKALRETEMRAANRDLAAALNASHSFGPADAEAISRFHGAMGALQTETIEHVIAMRAILTPNQAAKFDKTVSETLAAPDR
jgi:Spy/CpxP family protein refolding chaperone